MDINKLNFKIIDNINGYDICFSQPKHKLNIKLEKGVFFIKKDGSVLFVADSNLDQFHMKEQCEKYILAKDKNSE